MSSVYGERYGLSGEAVRRLANFWYNRKLKECGWPSFDAFVQWAEENDYAEQAQLGKRDPNLPHSPENTCWTVQGKSGADTGTGAMLTENPCNSCGRKNYCRTPCTLRARWWDIRIGKIRKQLTGEGRTIYGEN